VNDHSKICSMKLSEEDSAALQYAVRNHCASPPHTSNAAAAIDAPAAVAPCRRQACQHREDESALACLPPFCLRAASAAAASVLAALRRELRAPTSARTPPLACPSRLTPFCRGARALRLVPALPRRPAHLGHGGREPSLQRHGPHPHDDLALI
jgi:hypothetical protein